MVELKDTLLMPNTKFPMRGNLPNKEPEFLKRWEEMDLYNKILEKNQKEKQKGGVICLHDSNHKPNSPSKAPENTISALNEYFKKCGDTNGHKM